MAISDFNTVRQTLATKADTYSKTETDSKFTTKAGGFTQFVNVPNSQAVLRSQIGAIGADSDVFAKVNSYLSDMATSDTAKATIRANIGAAKAGEFQEKLIDSGWIRISNTQLYIRQFGNVVSVQGVINSTPHSGVVFTIPNSINPPTYSVYQSLSFADNEAWSVKINAGSRDCVVAYCDGGCQNLTNFSLTYMI